MTGEDWGLLALVVFGGVGVGAGVYYATHRHPTSVSPPPSPPTPGGGGQLQSGQGAAYPVAYLVADQEDWEICALAGIPTGAIYYVGVDPFAQLAQQEPGVGYQAPAIPQWTGAATQPPRVVLVGAAATAYNQGQVPEPYASLIRAALVTELVGATRVQTQQAVAQYVRTSQYQQ